MLFLLRGVAACGLRAQLVPLDRLPLYAVDSYPNRYWTAQRNTTEWHLFMSELTAAGNALSRLMLQALAPSLPGAHVGEALDYLSPRKGG